MAKDKVNFNVYGNPDHCDGGNIAKPVVGKVINAALRRGHLTAAEIAGETPAVEHTHLGSGVSSAKGNKGATGGQHPSLGDLHKKK